MPRSCEETRVLLPRHLDWSLPPASSMTHRFGMIRRFRFNRPQRIAAALLAIFLLQGLWLTSRQTLTDQDYQYARCGRETWEKPSPLAGYYTSCGNIHDGILAYRLAGLPLTLNLLVQRGLDHLRSPENRVVQTGGEVSTWELRHQMTHILLLLRLPFLAAGCILGGCIWWVTRRLYGDLGGYTALALYCFCPAILHACVQPSPEILAALGVYGGIYTCDRRCACHAGAAPQVAAAHHSAYRDSRHGGGLAHRGAAGRGPARPGSHALGCRGPSQSGAAGDVRGIAGRDLPSVRQLRFLCRCLQLCLPFRKRIHVVLARSREALLHARCRMRASPSPSLLRSFFTSARAARAISATRLRCSAPPFSRFSS